MADSNPVKTKAMNALIADAIATESDECILWPYATNSGGYPVRTYNGRSTYVTRIVCTAKKGPPKYDWLEAAHSCHTKRCINGNHLSWMTRLENARDNYNNPNWRKYWGLSVKEH